MENLSYNKTLILGESSNENPQVLKYSSHVIRGLLSIVPNSGTYHEFEKEFSGMTYQDAETDPWLKSFFEESLMLTNISKKQSLKEFWSELPMTKNGFIHNSVNVFGEGIKKFIEDHTKLCGFENTLPCLEAIASDRINFFNKYLGYFSTKFYVNH